MNIKLELSEQELATINNALNEICNIDHIADWEFPTRIGVDREQARQVLEKINDVLRGLRMD